jgi:hypothetical protein
VSWWEVNPGNRPVGAYATGYVPLADSAGGISTNAALGRVFRLLAGASRMMNAPTNAKPGHVITYQIKNNTGVAITITWNAVFKLGGTYVSPGMGKIRTITFAYDGTNWWEVSRTSGDA